MNAALHVVGLAVLGFASTSLDNLGVLTALFAARDLRARSVAGAYLGATATATGLGWAASVVATLAIGDALDFLGWIPVALGLRAAWLLRRPTSEATTSLPGGASAAVFLLAATSADNLLIAVALFAHASGALDLAVAVTLTICSLLWCALAFWLARRSPFGAALQRIVRPLLPLVLIAVGAHILIQA